MKKFETRTMKKDEAIGFIQNMRWFAGFGPISTKPIPNRPGFFAVRAKLWVWTHWVSA